MEGNMALSYCGRARLASGSPADPNAPRNGNNGTTSPSYDYAPTKNHYISLPPIFPLSTILKNPEIRSRVSR
jgi:hypothetical protein